MTSVLFAVFGLGTYKKYKLFYIFYSFLLLAGFSLFFLLFPIKRQPLRIVHDLINIFSLISCVVTTLYYNNVYRKIGKLQDVKLIWLFILLSFTVYNVLLNILSYKLSGVYYTFVYYVPNFIMSLYCLKFTNLLRQIERRLQDITLNVMSSDFDIVASRYKFIDIWLQSKQLNDISNVPLATIFIASFMNVTETLYLWLKSDFSHKNEMLLDSIVWLSANVWRIVFMCAACEGISRRIQEIAFGIHKKLLCTVVEDDHTALLQFSLQLVHENIEFWACGLFKLDNKLLYYMLGATTTYSVLIFQLKI